MNTHVVLVYTHDSIGLGEDGPTRQPIKHLASLRAMPSLNAGGRRPADIDAFDRGRTAEHIAHEAGELLKSTG